MRILSVSLFILSASAINSGVHAVSRGVKCPIVEECTVEDNELMKNGDYCTPSKNLIIEGELSEGGAYPTRAFLSAKTPPFNIRVVNEEKFPIDVYFFTGPPNLDPGGTSNVFTNSLGTKTIGASNQVTFAYTNAITAGAQAQTTAAGKLQTSDVTLIDVTLKAKTAPTIDKINVIYDGNRVEATRAVPSPLGGQVGAFQIQTGTQQPNDPPLLIGMGTISDGVFMLSSYVESLPGRIYNIQPALTFYIQIGKYERGVDANYKSVASTAAVIDTTTTEFSGINDFFVKRTVDGSWEVTTRFSETEASQVCS